jgi:photosystem II CP47 chlorophyll apoprotein
VDIERRVKSIDSIITNKSWEQIPDKLVLYDYIGSNPAKGGLFRSGPMFKGDGLVQNWVGFCSFESENFLRLAVISVVSLCVSIFISGFMSQDASRLASATTD